MTTKIGSGKPLAPMPITDDQREWLELEKGSTLNSYATIIRRLLQAEVDRAKKRGIMG